MAMQVEFFWEIGSIEPLFKPSQLIIVCTLFIYYVRWNFLHSGTCTKAQLVNNHQIIVVKEFFESCVPQHSS